MRAGTVIVGGGVAGGRLARELAAGGSRALVVSAEDVPPYDRTRLSKDIFSGGLAALRRAGQDEARGYDLRPGRRAVALDADRGAVTLDDGTVVGYGRLVIATGLRPRKLKFPGHDLDRVHYLRSLRDGLAIERDVDPRAPTVIVGGGLIGCEIAAALAAIGAPTVVVEAAAEPLAATVGTVVGHRIRKALERAGVSFRTSDSVAAILGTGRFEGVRLASGAELPAAAVIVAVGSEPETGWLAGCGLELHDGYVPVDGSYRTSLTGVYAIGDITIWTHPAWGRLHVEHEAVAHAHALGLARYLVAGEPPRPATPYAWSDQGALRLRVAGHLPGPADGAQVATRVISSGTGLVAAFVVGGVVLAAASVDDERGSRLAQRLLRNGPVTEDAWFGSAGAGLQVSNDK